MQDKNSDYAFSYTKTNLRHSSLREIRKVEVARAGQLAETDSAVDDILFDQSWAAIPNKNGAVQDPDDASDSFGSIV